MAGATGEVGYSSQGRTPIKMNFDPFPAGDYDLTLLGGTIEIKGKPEPGKLPYVNLAFEAAGTATTEGGKDKRVYHMLFVNLEPSPKTGTPIVDQANQLLGLAKALGAELEFGSDAILRKDKENDDGDMVKVNILDPRQVVEWLKQFDGAQVRAHVRVKKGTKDYPNDKNEIAYFIEAGGDETPDEIEEEEEEAPPPTRKNGKNGANGHKKNGKR